MRGKKRLLALWIGFLFPALSAALYATDEHLIGKKKTSDTGLKIIPGMLDESYDQIYPYYLKFCATTRIHPYKGKGIKGSIAGHGLYFLKGICPDKSVVPAALKLCPSEMDIHNPDTGVGLSVNRSLKNTNFIVIPGARMFLAARIFTDEAFDFNIKTRIINELIESGVFNGVKFHDKMVPDTILPEHYEEYLARHMFGSDFGIAMARNMYCINIPLNSQITEYIKDSFNQLNDSHRASMGEKYRGILSGSKKQDNDYHWSPVYNNCVHPAWNVLAGLGIIRSKPVNRPLIQQLFNIAIPANTILDLHQAVNEQEIEPEKMYKQKALRDAFLKYNWIPQQSGALIESVRLARPNHIFKEDGSIFVLRNLFESRKKYLRKISSNPDFSVQGHGKAALMPNLRRSRARYAKALKNIQQLKNGPDWKNQTLAADTGPHDHLEREVAGLKRALLRITSEKERKFLRGQLHLSMSRLKAFTKTHDYVTFIRKLECYLKDQMAWANRQLEESDF